MRDTWKYGLSIGGAITLETILYCTVLGGLLLGCAPSPPPHKVDLLGVIKWTC